MRGWLRLIADGKAKKQTPEWVAQWVDGEGLPARAVVDAICDTLGIAFVEDLFGYSARVPELSLALAERLHIDGDQTPPETRQRVLETARQRAFPGGVARLLALGLAADNIPGLTTDLRERLFELTRKVQDSRIPHEPAPVFAWLDLCAASARVNAIALAAAESLVSGEGWYRCWLRFVCALSRAEALDTALRSAAAVNALGILVEERNPFVGDPRACDLYGLDEPIVGTLRRALRLVSDSDWSRALGYLADVSKNMTTTIQSVFGGPLPPTVLLVVAVEAMTTPVRRAAVEGLTSLMLTERAGNLLYSYVGEFHLAAARIALASGDRDTAIKEWRTACEMMAAYGYRKDTTIYELLDSLPSLIAADPGRARAALEVVQPLVWRTYRHTDGKGTRQGPAQWWGLLAEVDPIALCKLISVALVSGCNLLNRTLEGARLDLWQAQWAKIDPIVSGALRLSLGPGLDRRDPSALRRLYESGENGDIVTTLARLLLARADERTPDASVSDQEKLERQRATVQDMNEVARAFGGASIDTEVANVTTERSRSSNHAPTPERRPVRRVIDDAVRETFGPTTLGLGRVLRVWRSRPYQASAAKWDVDRFVNALGYRVLSLLDQGYAESAEAVLYSIAVEEKFGEEGRLLSALGDGFELWGHRTLAAVAFTYAWTRTRGGGGWLAFGGETGLDRLRRAAQLDAAATLRTLGDEAQRRADRGDVGVTQALVHAFAQVPLGTNGSQTAFDCWREAAQVIAFRTPKIGDADEPEHPYMVSNLQSEEDVGEHTATEALDRACALAAVAGIAQPGREHKRRSFVAISLLLEARTSIVADACAEVIDHLSDVATLTWLLRVIESASSRVEVAQRCQASLARVAQGPYLTARAIAARLLRLIGEPERSPPSSEEPRQSGPEPTFGNDRDGSRSDRFVAAVVSRQAESRLSAAASMFPKLRDIASGLVAIDLNSDEKQERWQHQKRGLVSSRSERIPNAVVWFVEIVEDALQRAAAQGRMYLASRGRVVSDPVGWESALSDLLLTDTWLPLASEQCREPRPANLTTPAHTTGGPRWDEPVPVVSGGAFDGWKILASAEDQEDASTVSQESFSKTRILCAVERRKREDESGLEYPPLGLCDPETWRTSFVGQWPDGEPLPEGAVIGAAIGRKRLGDVVGGLGVHLPVLVPAPHIIASLKLRRGREPLRLYDDKGLALVTRTWRSHYEGSEYELPRPRFSGSQILMRPDTFRGMEALTEGGVVWREHVLTYDSRQEEYDSE